MVAKRHTFSNVFCIKFNNHLHILQHTFQHHQQASMRAQATWVVIVIAAMALPAIHAGLAESKRASEGYTGTKHSFSRFAVVCKCHESVERLQAFHPPKSPTAPQHTPKASYSPNTSATGLLAKVRLSADHYCCSHMHIPCVSRQILAVCVCAMQNYLHLSQPKQRFHCRVRMLSADRSKLRAYCNGLHANM